MKAKLPRKYGNNMEKRVFVHFYKIYSQFTFKMIFWETFCYIYVIIKIYFGKYFLNIF